MAPHALVLTGGHAFDEAAFDELLAGLASVKVERVSHPDAADRLHPDRVDADVIVLYDMPGLRVRRGAPVEIVEPPIAVVQGWEALLAEGVPVVALHHSICSWPAWARFAEIIGGRFHYAPGRLAGREWPDSGYRHDVEQTVTVVAPDHPVCAGLPLSFSLTDETYLCPVFEDAVTPLLLTDARRTDADHESTAHALLPSGAERPAWHHPPGSPYLAWHRVVERSTVVYLQPGDGPSAFGNPCYQRLLDNTVAWAATTAP
jgi:hypothetical protein